MHSKSKEKMSFQISGKLVKKYDAENKSGNEVQEKMTVHFDLRGREWQDKYFTNLQAWKVEKAGDSSPKAGEQIVAPSSEVDPFAKEQNFDDLPF